MGSTQMQNPPFPYESFNTQRKHSYSWFSPDTGIYTSKHTFIQLPNNLFLDVVSFIFSHKHQGASALIDSSSGCTISYTQLPELVKSIASGLHEIGISQGQVVLLLLPNTIYFPVIYLGVLSLGAIVTTMSPLSSFHEIKKRVSDCNVVLAFTISAQLEKIGKLGVQAIVVPETGDFDLSSTEFSCFSKLMLTNPNYMPRPVINQNDTATILYSSGTSGVSKGVVITHGNLIATVVLFVQLGASQYDYPGWENVYLAALPMFHVFGLSLLATGLLSLGSTIVVMREFNVDEMVRAIDRYRVTHFPLVPPILMVLTRAKRVGIYDFGSLKQVMSGAAPLSKNTIHEFLENFPFVDFFQFRDFYHIVYLWWPQYIDALKPWFPIVQDPRPKAIGYGMTESTAVGTYGFNTKEIRKYTSVGLLAPNMEAKVVDYKTGYLMPPGEKGELWLRGPGIMKGYLNDLDATLSTVDKDGWLHTGDVVHFDQDGFLYVSERLKEMIKYKGYQIAPADLENALISHPEILDVAVTAATSKEVGEIPVAFVVKRPGSAISPEDVVNYVSEQVAPYKRVRKVVFTNSIPRSAAGKILRRELRSKMVSRM